MEKQILKYASFIFGLTFLLASCDDIVTYNDGYDDGKTSYGPPVIEYISTVGSPDDEITEGSFNQMLILHGENLSQVESLLFNDQEVDLTQIYAISKQITVSVPGIVPDEITNTITLKTKKGETTFPFTISFPDLVISGISHEFASAGEVVDILGENLLLYDLTPENGDIKISGKSVTIVNCTEQAVSILIPEGITDNAPMTISSDRIQTVIGETIELTYRDTGVRFVDAGPGLLSNPSVIGATDGSNPGDPSPVIPGTNFLRLNTAVNAWSYTFILNWYVFDLPAGDPVVTDLLVNQANYDLRYEILVRKDNPLTSPDYTMQVGLSGSDANNQWKPAESGAAYDTDGRWCSRRIDMGIYMKDGASNLQETGNWIYYAFINGTGNTPEMDIALANFCFVKKLSVRKQQKK